MAQKLEIMRQKKHVSSDKGGFLLYFLLFYFLHCTCINYFLKNTFYMSWMIYLGIPGNAETAGSTAITRTGERNANEVWTTKASNTNEADAGLRISWKCESFAKVYSNHTIKTIIHLVYASQELPHVAIAYCCILIPGLWSNATNARHARANFQPYQFCGWFTSSSDASRFLCSHHGGRPW